MDGKERMEKSVLNTLLSFLFFTTHLTFSPCSYIFIFISSQQTFFIIHLEIYYLRKLKFSFRHIATRTKNSSLFYEE